MRTLVIALLVVLGVVAIWAAAEVTPLGNLERGSYSALPRAEGLEVLSPELACQATSVDPCPVRYAYRPDGRVTAWFSVRNKGQVPVTLEGVSDGWFGLFRRETLLRPISALDGGDPVHGVSQMGVPFRPLVLAAGAQRILGIEFRATDDVAHACRSWSPGTAIVMEQVPVTWRWLLMRHDETIPLLPPIQLQAPVSRDCAR